MTDTLLRFAGVSHSFGSVLAVDEVSLAIRRGEVFSLLGPSGCGKTTLLRICAGFQRPDRGRIILDGADLTDLPPEKRQVNTVFQNYALFPHLNVFDNIAFGLRIARRPEAEVRREVGRMLELTDMGEHAGKRVEAISGGQKQRVAIARALINRPLVLLLDEPLAALDLKLRQRMLVELDSIHDEVGITFLYVTHDQGEAMSISDTIAVMNRGRVEQIGSPAEIYEAPQSSFVAAFIGDTNFFDGAVREADGDYCRVAIEGFADVLLFNDKKVRPGGAVHLSLRPEKLLILQEPPPAGEERRNTVRGIVEEVVYLGAATKYWVRVGEYRLAVYRQHRRFLLDEKPIKWGDSVWLNWHADDGYMLERYSEADEELLSLPDTGFEAEAGSPPGPAPEEGK
ncbi:MAG: ABC transporter ATP-binding protein [Planctomycetota bacterium]|jgi:spermidine/putrescine transport system ATP-binding protein|nr:ABC transporter ATP-binding protein [Planctomycetota bacterium]